MSGSTELTAAEQAALRELLDRNAITNTLNTYWQALDSRSFDLFDDVFAPEIEIDGKLLSLAALKRLLARVAQYPTSHHNPTTIRIEIDGDRARCNSFVMDFLTLDPPGRPPAAPDVWPLHDDRAGAALRFHGLRYVDELERRPEGWRVTRRRGPIALWRAELAGISFHPDYEHLRSAPWPNPSQVGDPE